MGIIRVATIALATLATIVGLGMFFFGILALVAGRFDHVLIYAGVFTTCLWYIARVMRGDRRQRLAAEARLPPEQRPQRRRPRRPVTFQLRETATAFVIWAILVGALGLATGQPTAVTIGMAVFAGFMLATITVAGRHMMFRLTADDDGEDEDDRPPMDQAAKDPPGR